MLCQLCRCAPSILAAPQRRGQTGDKGKFVFAGVQAAPENFGTIRMDYTLGKNDSLFGTFLRDPANYTQPDAFNDTGSVSSTSRTTIALEENHTFGSNFVNAARVGFNRDNVQNLFTPTAINPLSADTTTVDAIPGQTAPRFIGQGRSYRLLRAAPTQVPTISTSGIRISTMMTRSGPTGTTPSSSAGARSEWTTTNTRSRTPAGAIYLAARVSGSSATTGLLQWHTQPL